MVSDIGRKAIRSNERIKLEPVEPSLADKENAMFFSRFLILSIVLFVAWILGYVAFPVAGGLIHLLLIVAVISLIVHFARGRP